MSKNIFNILTDGNSNSESAKTFNTNDLMANVTVSETDTHVIIENFPTAFGDTQNKNNRVYDQDSLIFAVNQFNDIVKENPYFKYIFDGHRDDDSYEYIAGAIINLRLNEQYKCIFADLKINKGCNSQPVLKNILKDGDPIGISMRILSPNSIHVSKDDLQEIAPDIVFLEDDNENLAKLMSKDTEIEYITGEAFIWRLDLTQFPSFNDTFIVKQTQLKDESAVKTMSTYKTASTTFLKTYTQNYCKTNSCKFRNMIKDFVDLINKNESITSIKDYPDLYDDMLKFSYMNLSEFEFDKISNVKYLTDKLKDFELDMTDVNEQNDTLIKIIGPDNIISYIISNGNEADLYINLLNTTMLTLIDEDDIFYQIVTINYLHQLCLATLILTNHDTTKVNNVKKIYDKLESTLKENDVDSNIKTDLLKKLDTNSINLYDFTNELFFYLYQYTEQFSSLQAPVTIISGALKHFNNAPEIKGLNKTTYVNKNPVYKSFRKNKRR